MHNFLDGLPAIDWSDFTKASEISQDVVKMLAKNKSLLAKMLSDVEVNQELFSMCEHHDVLDKLVLYDALDRGFRIRIHVASQNPAERIHEHRFSFTSFVLRGEYEHVFYAAENPAELDKTKYQKVYVAKERVGSCYTMHHSVFHTTYMSDGMVSLILRGISEKERAVIVDKDTLKVWWRYTDSEETPKHRKSVQMSLDRYRSLVNRLESYGIISSTSN